MIEKQYMPHKVTVPWKKVLKVMFDLKVIAEIKVIGQRRCCYFDLPVKIPHIDNICKCAEERPCVSIDDLRRMICPKPKLTFVKILSQKVSLN